MVLKYQLILVTMQAVLPADLRLIVLAYFEKGISLGRLNKLEEVYQNPHSFNHILNTAFYNS